MIMLKTKQNSLPAEKDNVLETHRQTIEPVLVSFRILSICFCLNKKQQATNNIDGEEYESSDNLLGLQLKQMRDSIVKEIRIAGTPPSKTSSPRYRHDNVDNERQDPKDAILLLQAAKTVSWVEKVYFFAIPRRCAIVYQI